MQSLAEQKWALEQWTEVGIYAKSEHETATLHSVVLLKINTPQGSCPNPSNALSTQKSYYAS